VGEIETLKEIKLKRDITFRCADEVQERDP
jgi:hypothetical protein